VLDIQGGILLVPSGHALAMWDPKDARLSRWHPSKPLEELLQVVREMDLDPPRGEEQSSIEESSIHWPQDQSVLLPNGKRPAADMATAGEQVRQTIKDEQAQIQYLKPARAKASSCMNKDRFSEAHVNNWSLEDEWATQVDDKGDITLRLTFEQKVCVLGMSLGHGTQGREFTCVTVSENKKEDGIRIDLPPATSETRDFTTWFQHSVEGREIVLTFNMNSVIGDRGAPGLAYVALVGYMVGSEKGEPGKKAKKNRA
jgi:hypothetical protein